MAITVWARLVTADDRGGRAAPLHAEEVGFVSGRTRVYGIIGDPIAQVRSPEMISAALAARKVDALMIPVHVLPADFEGCVAQLKRVQNVDGFVFTIPYKRAAAALADELGTHARNVGAINALARRPHGRWTGEIFDGIGCVEAFRRRGLPIAGRRLMLIGAGGAGAAIGIAMAYERPESIRLYDVDPQRALDLAAKIRGVDASIGIEVGEPLTTGIDILLNASPVGMLSDARMPVDVATIASPVIVFDAIVTPEPTQLIARAAARGCRTVQGREMMRGQIAKIVDFFVGPAATG